MELYYKDLISKEASLDKLVDDLMLVVQGANEFAEAASARIPHSKREEIRWRLERLKAGCHQIKEQALASALATDKLLRQYPYSVVGFAFAGGLLAGLLAKKRSR
jgi:ElaB/YqjD/DUF883 family membrane-anchored ribosome-binding protein